jgi:hypothetical protein
MTTRQGIPLRPDPSARAREALSSLWRAAVAVGRQARDLNIRAADLVADDRIAGLLVKAATPPMGLADSVSFQHISYAFFASLGVISAGAALLGKALQLQFDGSASISLPTMAPGTAAFISAGLPAPVYQFVTSAGPAVVPHKMMAFVELTNEMLLHSNADQITQAALTESAAKGLDSILFDALPADTVRPAGLRNGVAALTPASGGTAMTDDVEAMAKAVSRIGGELVFVAAPEQAVALAVRSVPPLAYAVLPTASLPAGTALCVAPQALAAVLGAIQIDAARGVGVTIHESGAPLPIVGASGPTMASPIRSTFQTDTAVLRLRQELSWALRGTGAVSWTEGCTW